MDRKPNKKTQKNIIISFASFTILFLRVHQLNHAFTLLS